MKKRGKNDKSFNIIFIIIIVVILIAIIFIGYLPKTVKDDGADLGTAIEITPVELAANKENYERKTITVKGAYVPSEAFIYVRNNNAYEKIFIQPPVKVYCRNFDFKGMLQYNQANNRWIFNVENSVCLDV